MQAQRAPGGTSAYRLGLITTSVLYLLVYGWILVRGEWRPFVMDANEAYGTLWHAANLYAFGVGQSWGLTDEAYGPNAAAHPFVYTHQGNFPRLFAFLVYLLGARTIETQTTVTMLTVGLIGVLFAYRYFSRLTRPLFGVIAASILMTDYILFAQWHIVTFRVWHAFFFFGGLLCVHGAGGRHRRRWLLLTVGCIFGLFYFEIKFAIFTAIFLGPYTFVRYRTRWQLVLSIWAAQATGALLSALLLLGQLAAYLGWSGMLEDIQLTYGARNVAGGDQSARQPLLDFISSHNIVFWRNFVDGTIYRTPSSFVHTLYDYVFATYTPLIVLLTVVLLLGWALDLIVRGRWPARWPRFRRPFRGPPAMPRLDLGLDLLIVAAGPVAVVGWVGPIGLLGIAPGNPAAPDPSLAGALLIGAALVGAMCAGVVLVCRPVLQCQARHEGPVRRLAAVLLVVATIRYQQLQIHLFEQGYRPLWLAAAGGGADPGWAALLADELVSGAVAVGLVVVLFGRSRVIARPVQQVRRMAVYAGCGCLAYVAIYVLAPGYVYSGYLVRYAPLPVFLTTPLIAVAIYLPTAIAVDGVREFWRRRGHRDSRHDPTEPAARSWNGGRVRWARVALTGLAAVLGVGMAGLWVHTQWQYTQLLPPDDSQVFDALSRPEYRGASSASNTYAAPIAAYTGTWSYIDSRLGEGKIRLTDDGFDAGQDLDTYLWVVDRHSNPDYLKPQYYVCLRHQGMATALQRLTGVVEPGNRCDDLPLVGRTGGIQPFLQHRTVAEDQSPSNTWAIVRFDWDYPPFLMPLDQAAASSAGTANRSVERVRMDPVTLDGRQAVRVRYRYAQQDGQPERGTVVRLYGGADDGPLELLDEVHDGDTLAIPAGFSGLLRASVTPSTATKSGPSYYSRAMAVGTVEAGQPPAASQACSTDDVLTQAAVARTPATPTMLDAHMGWLAAWHTEDITKVQGGQITPGPLGAPVTISPGHLIFDSGDQTLYQLDDRGTASAVIPADDQCVALLNAGAWDENRGAFVGLVLQYGSTGWTSAGADIAPANSNADLKSTSDTTIVNPDIGNGKLPGFTIEADDDSYVIRYLSDMQGPFVRIESKWTQQRLVLVGTSPLTDLSGAPVTVRTEARPHGNGTVVLSMFDGSRQVQKATNVSAGLGAGDQWSSVSLQYNELVYPHPGSRFAVALYGVGAGDWLDVRELSLLIGSVPPFVDAGGASLVAPIPPLGAHALYVADGATIREGATVLGADGQMRLLRQGELVMDGSTSQIVRVGRREFVAHPPSHEDDRVQVDNLGTWDAGSHSLQGLTARFADGRWALDTADFKPSNPDAHLMEGTDEVPAPYLQIRPDASAAQLVRMADDSGPFIRVVALRDMSFLALGGHAPLSSYDAVPVSLVGQIRSSSSGQAMLTLHDSLDSSGKAHVATTQMGTTGAWQTLGLRGIRVEFPSGADTYDIGLNDVHAGDTFDVRELSLYVGAIPIAFDKAELTDEREMLGTTDGLQAFYVPGDTAVLGQVAVGPSGQDRILQSGDLVYTGAAHEVVRIDAGGVITKLGAPNGAQLTIANLGEWDQSGGRFRGLKARFDGAEWRIDTSSMHPVGADFHATTSPGVLPTGFWLSPDGSNAQLEMEDGLDGRTVRITARQSSPYLVINGRQPLDKLDSVPVTLRAMVRARPGTLLTLTIYDVTDASGQVKSTVESRAAPDGWTELVARTRAMFASPSDNFSVGLNQINSGDWFEVRDVELFIGALP